MVPVTLTDTWRWIKTHSLPPMRVPFSALWITRHPVHMLPWAHRSPLSDIRCKRVLLYRNPCPDFSTCQRCEGSEPGSSTSVLIGSHSRSRCMKRQSLSETAESWQMRFLHPNGLPSS